MTRRLAFTVRTTIYFSGLIYVSCFVLSVHYSKVVEDCAADQGQRLLTVFEGSASQRAETKQNDPSPLSEIVKSFPNSGRDDPMRRRNCLAVTATPSDVPLLVERLEELLNAPSYDAFSCIHISIPYQSMRFRETYPTTNSLRTLFKDERIILHRLFDYGPMTRYLGPLFYEQHPNTSIVVFDVDTKGLVKNKRRILVNLVVASQVLDTEAVWCNQGENFEVVVNSTDPMVQEVRPAWETFPMEKNAKGSWNQVHFCRGVGGLLFKPKHFANFWYNQTDYHASCFWDDDRWVSFQVDRQGFPLKVVQELSQARTRPISPVTEAQHGRRLGSLTHINRGLASDQTCTLAWIQHHPEAYPTARALIPSN